VETTAGPHRVAVREGARAVYEGQVTLPEGDRPRTVLLNPDRQHRYVLQNVYYGKETAPFDFYIPPSGDYDVTRALAQLKLATPDPWVAGPFDAVFAETPPAPEKGVSTSRVRICHLTVEDHALLQRGVAEASQRPPHPLPASGPMFDALKRARAACP
jgi:hypothetical protein